MLQYYNFNFLFPTFFGLGNLSKKFPGTIGSLIALPVCYFISRMMSFAQNYVEPQTTILLPILIMLVMFFVGVYTSNRYATLTKQTDPKEVIIDEVVGQSLCILITMPFTISMIYNAANAKGVVIYVDLVLIISLISNLLLFRFFDILKPWPISWCDRKIKGGIGIMLDDIVAAIFAIVVYFAGLFFIVDWL